MTGRAPRPRANATSRSSATRRTPPSHASRPWRIRYLANLVLAVRAGRTTDDSPRAMLLLDGFRRRLGASHADLAEAMLVAATNEPQRLPNDITAAANVEDQLVSALLDAVLSRDEIACIAATARRNRIGAARLRALGAAAILRAERLLNRLGEPDGG